MTRITSGRKASTAATEVEDKWGLFVALGAGLLIAGCVASINFFVTTLVSILYIAAVMFAGGLMQLAHAIANRGWKKRLLGVVSGVFFMAASGFIVLDPALSEISVTLAAGVLLVGAGVLRIIAGFGERGRNGSFWIALSGLLTLAAGLTIVVTWPAGSLWLIGFILSTDLIFQGGTFLVFGLALRSRDARGTGQQSV
ncbi:HdeD family acid-resistance protein [Rhizobium cauense]|uniref:HdeD family acid-resistance protein n=1 Tax=Rhizobium cauense TaxID=1166683 RepID=UPI001C6F3C18|nr:HdeD family acid-resistance protein [Rhizobium cauense]MBW9116865.1 HdeD family acid-resistance protein [Rhizobium cauense]